MREASSKAVLPVVLVALAAACGEPERSVDAAFAGPVGMTLAGPNRDELFIANSEDDALQVVLLTQDLADLALVESEAIYFPLRIPAGGRPTRLAATPDGRFVFVLDEVSYEVRLVDAIAHAPVSSDTAILALPAGPLGARATDMIAAPNGCAAPCIGRVYVTLAGRGEVLPVDLVEDTAGLSLVPGAALVVGGAPARIAATADGRFLFVTDSVAPELVRVDVAQGIVERLPIGEVGDPLAVSSDGTLVVVGRPAARDVVVVQAASQAEWGIVDANPAFAPTPQCVNACGEAPFCLEPRPSDEALCVQDATLATAPTGPYEGLYVARPPLQIAILGVPAGQPALQFECADEPGVIRTFNEYAIVVTSDATANGPIWWVPLRDAQGVPAPALASAQCQPASLTSTPVTDLDGDEIPTSLALASYLGPCPPAPERARFACVASDDGAGVVALPGNAAQRAQWTFEWENALAGLDRQGNPSGDVREDGSFTDVFLPFESFAAVQPRRVDAVTGEVLHHGDVLEILSKVRDAPDCPLDPSVPLCQLERRIVGIEHVGGRAVLSFAEGEELPDACFRDGGAIEYRIRVGDGFSVTAPAGQAYRVQPGQRFGPGGNVAQDQPVIFDVQALDAQAGASACVRYDEAGDALPPLPAVLSRNRRFGFTVDDKLAPVRGGKAFDFEGARGPAGTLAGDLLVWPGLGGRPRAFVTFSGSDSLYGFIPYDAAGVAAGGDEDDSDAADPDDTKFRILQ